MKIKKKTAMAISFTMGILMFATTAMAEISSKSGYEQAKDALKYSAESFTTKLSNYTLDVSMIMKSNDKIIISESTLNKYDLTKNASENVSTSVEGSKKTSAYYYSDNNIMVNKNDQDGTYYVTEYETPRKGRSFTNPFKEKEAADVEKIIDAVVGNLKDYVVVDEKADGSKELSGSISEAQIPALINAVASYTLKNETAINRINDEENIMPKITKDVYVKEVKGKMTVDQHGLMQNFFGTGILVGKDNEGKEHNLTFELLGKIYDINSTNVNKPNLSGKKVEKHIEKNRDSLANLEMYVGKYKNDIIIEKNGKFQKIGERILEITQSNNESIVGRYHEEYVKGYENYSEKKQDINFNAKYTGEDRHDAEIVIEGYSSKGNINLYRGDAKIYFGVPTSSDGRRWYSGEFYRVFE
ncbi:hypothetical protein GCM10008905_09380 [Clostridium malenominatum]|uniref:Surface layer protein n=1 Tax=Clostridium malenominatum TaxID=1539 RepID=A0ABN1IS52_9CLOT